MPRTRKAASGNRKTHKSKRRAVYKIPGVIDVPYIRNNPSLTTNFKKSIQRMTHNGIRIKNREYVGGVQGSTGTSFSCLSSNINPLSRVWFPWLKQIAQGYTEYKFHSLKWEYVSTTGQGTAGNVGILGFATNFNANDGSYDTLAKALAEQGAVAGSPCDNMVHVTDCSRQPYNRLFVSDWKQHAIQGKYDPKTYDIGVLNIFTQNNNTSGSMGTLFVEYDVEFFRPTVGEAPPASVCHRVPANPSSSSPFGTNQGVTNYDSFSAVYQAPKTVGYGTADGINGWQWNSTQCTLPANLGYADATYQFYYFCYGGSVAITVPTVSTTNTVQANLYTGSQYIQATATGSTSTQFFLVFYFKIIDTTQPTTITFGASGVLPSSITQCDIFITQLPSVVS